MLNPLLISASSITPASERHTAPSPPYTLVPPRMMAAIACSATPSPFWADPVATRDTLIAPPMPAAAPLSANVRIRTRSTRTPDSTAASTLPPTA